MTEPLLPSPAGRTVRILLADDHAQIRDRIATVLTDAGYTVVGAVADGVEAVNAEGPLQPDVLVLDVSMPRLTGLEVAQQVRRRGSSTVIICLTAHPPEEMLQPAWDAGAIGYVSKLSMMRDLVPAIEEGLQGRRFVSKRFELASPPES
jgi:DNA-binding NarL/FixJ family response regulator